MFNLLRRDRPNVGFVHFRGNLPTRAEEFRFLEKHGVELQLQKPTPATHWVMKLSHPSWGSAEMMCPNKLPEGSPEIEFVTSLSDLEKAAVRSSRSVIAVKTPAVKKTVLRDRKNLLRYLGAVMGADGVAAYDIDSSLWWSRGMLDDELSHDADLDIEALYCTHAVNDGSEGVKDDAPVSWLHTHGLAELGAWDFDIVRPHEDFATPAGADALRSIAFSILEEKIKPTDGDVLIGWPNIRVSFVTADEFMRSGPTAQRKIRQMADGDRSHQEKRSVVCDPKKSGLKSLFGGGGIQAAKFFMGALPEQGAFTFTTAATELMAQRARQTLSLVPSICDELRELSPQIGAKIGYVVDGGKGDEREHMWFTVHEIRGNQMDATLEVKPFNIARMKHGDRGMHSVEQLTDWLISTPIGMITPRSFRVLRMLRQNPELKQEIIDTIKSNGG